MTRLQPLEPSSRHRGSLFPPGRGAEDFCPPPSSPPHPAQGAPPRAHGSSASGGHQAGGTNLPKSHFCL